MSETAIKVKERAILFSTSMVQAILAGRKTQTRRIVKTAHCPYGDPGDRLWVREKFRKYCHVDQYGFTHSHLEVIEYAADNPHEFLLQVDGDGFQEFNKDGSEKFIPWKPSIHMPRSASRITLEITGIRVERLQDISESDAKKEGDPKQGLIASENTHVEWFKQLWHSINGPDSWSLNPWVWVIEFKKI